MAVTYSNPAAVRGGVRLTWQSDAEDPTFYVYRDGVLIATTKQRSMMFSGQAGEQVVVEVLDDADGIPVAAYPGRVWLRWKPSTDTAKYRVEEYVGAAWTARASILHDGRLRYTFRTRYLEDSTTHLFRVVPVGENGNDGTPKTWSVLCIRHPDVPDASYSYASGTGLVTITAA